MAYLWPPFSGALSKRFAYHLAARYLAEQVHNLSSKKVAVGTEWIDRKISLLPGARYHQVNPDSPLSNEAWFIPFMKKDPAKTFKKYSKAVILNACSAADTIFGSLPPGTYAPGADVWGEVDEMHSGTNISKHVSGQGTGWTDLLIFFFSQLDPETREGGKIAKAEIEKLLRNHKTCWLVVQQVTPVRTETRKVFRRAMVKVGPSGDTAYRRFVGGRSHGYSDSPFSCAMDAQGSRAAFIRGAHITYKRLDTNSMLANGDLLREDGYEPESDPNYRNDAFYHDTQGNEELLAQFEENSTVLG